jgi:uncharacterized protein YbcI
VRPAGGVGWVELLAGLLRFLSRLVVHTPVEEAVESLMEQQNEGPRSLTSQICDTAVQLLREYTGRGPTKAKATINGDSVMLVLGDTLTRGERRLAATGKAERVLQLRHDFQMVMRDELVEAVEDATGRKVIAFMSQNHIDPDLAVEVFILEPESAAADSSPGGDLA